MKQGIVQALIIFILIGFSLTSFSSSLPSAQADSSDSTWNLNVSGLVNHPLSFTLSDLKVLPQTTVSTILICVDFPANPVAKGNWTGVKLWTLLNETGVLPEAIKVAFYANDGYSTDLTIDVAKSDNIILAITKDGVPLSEVLRLVVPEHWGYKWISQIVKIEPVDYDFQGKWESLGYSDDGIITPSNQRDTLPFTSTPVITLPTTLSSTLPKETPAPSPSSTPINNSTSQSPTTESKNLTSENLNQTKTITVLSIVILAIVAVALIITIRTKNSNSKTLTTIFL